MSSDSVSGPPAAVPDRPRVTTGNRQADRILGGGFPVNSINILMGGPGTGKTLFAEQLIFASATVAEPALYLTTLSEPLSKVVTYLQGMPFYDAEKLGTAVHYEDMGADLSRGGVGALVPRVRDAITTLRPKLIVIDSFRAVHDLSSSAPEMRRLVSDLAGLLSAFDTTALLIGEYTDDDVQRYPEFAVADGVVEFARHKRTSRDERFMRVAKLRGSGYLEGLHALHIGADGVEIYPRLVSPDQSADYRISTERISTGVPGLDKMLNGGLWRGSTTLVIGPTGSGKTTLGIQFAVAGIEGGEPALYVNFQENPTQLARAIESIGSDIGRLKARGLELLYASSVELQIDRIIVDIFQRVEREKIRRVVIDAVGDLAMAADDIQRIHDYLYALVQRFAVAGVTALLMLEAPGLVTAPTAGEFGRLSYMCDNLILFEIDRGELLGRRVSVYKTRGSAHDERARPVSISSAGVEVE